MRWRAGIVRAAAHVAIRRDLTHARSLPALRSKLDRRARRAFRAPPFTATLAGEVGGIDGLWVTNRPLCDSVVLYFHGGFYILGRPESDAAMVSVLARKSGARIFLPRYRLAPEHPSPAAFTDALAAFEGLLAMGYAPQQIIIGGAAAGGGLGLALLAHLLNQGIQPAGAFAFSPWTDLTYSGASLVTNAAYEHMLPARRLTEIRAAILGRANAQGAADTRLSPLHASFPAPPPVQLYAAETEILRDDTLRMRNRLPDAEIRIVGDLPHLWPLFHNYLPEARETLAETAAFIRDCLHQSSTDS